MEERCLIQVIGRTTYPLLKAWVTDADARRKKVVALCRKIVAHQAYFEALPQALTVVQIDGGLRVLSEFDGVRNKKTPDTKQFERLHESVRTKLEAYKAELKGFMDKNNEYFTEYKAEMYKAGARPGFMDAEEYNVIFPIR